MNRYLSALAVAALMAGGACSRNNGKPADSALNTDLSLAAQQKTSLDSISAVERGNALTTAPAATPAPVTRTSSGEVSHTATTHRSTSTAHRSSGSSSGASSSGSSTVASEPRTVTEKHTKRDAAIGAGTGAVIGAVTSKNKVKGGIIGGVIGGVLGGVIGNNVDKKKKPVP
jgi:YmgG-like glycine-zipper protein